MFTAQSRSSTARRRVKFVIPVVVAAALALVGCTSTATPSSSSSSSAAASANPFKPEQKTVTGTMYQQPNAAQYLEAVGPASKYGLTLKNTWETDGGVGLSQLVAGDVDVLQTASARIADAVKQGVGLKIIAGNYISEAGFSTIETIPGKSGVNSLKQLKGKKIGLPSTVGLYANRLMVALTNAGVDPKSVTFVVVPYGSAAAALQQGTVDATASEGSVTPQLRTMGSKEIFDFGAKPFAGRVENVWAVTTKFADANPNTVAAFQCAVLQGGVKANTAAGAQSFFTKTLGYSAALAKSTKPVVSVTKPITAASIQSDYNDSIKIGVETAPFDMSTILLPEPTNCTK